jgi:hypothetical protein
MALTLWAKYIAAAKKLWSKIHSIKSISNWHYILKSVGGLVEGEWGDELTKSCMGELHFAYLNSMLQHPNHHHGYTSQD